MPRVNCSSILEYSLDWLRRAWQLLVSCTTAWVAKSCLYPYAFFLGIVTVVAIFQVIHLIDPPYLIRFPGAVDNEELLTAPAGLLPECVWDVMVFASPRALSQHPEFQTLTSRLKRVKNAEGSRFETQVACGAKQDKAPCSLRVSVSANESDLSVKDAVIFGLSPSSLRGRIDALKSDSLVKPNQLWIFTSVLSPRQAAKLNPKIGSFPVHLSWTYLSASALTTAYGYYVAGEPMDTNENNISTQPKHFLARKRKLVAWMGNNCGTELYWPRDAYINELSRHIQIDRYGPCTNLTCLPMNSEQCGMLMGQYKFFITFEIAECQDYITDQFWRTALLHQTVPVVYGAKKASYLKFAPPDSFIHAADFESPKKLADYLSLLGKNDGLYLKYFKWRSLGSIKEGFPPFKPMSLCKLIPYIEDAKVGRLKRTLVSDTKWYQSCRKATQNSSRVSSIEEWSPWK